MNIDGKMRNLKLAHTPCIRSGVRIAMAQDSGLPVKYSTGSYLGKCSSDEKCCSRWDDSGIQKIWGAEIRQEDNADRENRSDWLLLLISIPSEIF